MLKKFLADLIELLDFFNSKVDLMYNLVEFYPNYTQFLDVINNFIYDSVATKSQNPLILAKCSNIFSVKEEYKLAELSVKRAIESITNEKNLWLKANVLAIVAPVVNNTDSSYCYKLLEQAEAIIEEIPDRSDKDDSLKALFLCYLKINDLDNASRILSSIQYKKKREETIFNAIKHFLARKKQNIVSFLEAFITSGEDKLVYSAIIARDLYINKNVNRAKARVKSILRSIDFFPSDLQERVIRSLPITLVISKNFLESDPQIKIVITTVYNEVEITYLQKFASVITNANSNTNFLEKMYREISRLDPITKQTIIHDAVHMLAENI
ncbi:MAG: hypothetical protein ACTSVW_07860 [Candidatus Njordarchaeales archaeon]